MSDKDCCPGGMLLQDADISVLTLLGELLFLCYVFLGVALGADAFMASIEVITSKEKTHQVTDKVTGEMKVFHTRVWNATVANLTLMALGSSAPEILLSVVEVFANDMASGPLGPSTIVGSAAFNLMIITALCMVALADDETRTLKQLGVFIVTAAYSVWAYIWLLIIVVFWTPQVITVVEGVLTMVFFVMLIFNAYWADKYWDALPTWTRSAGVSKGDAALAIKKAGLSASATPEEIAKALKEEMEPPRTKAYYRKKMMEEKLLAKGAKNTAKVAPTSTGQPELEVGAGKSSDAADDGFKARPAPTEEAPPAGIIGWQKQVYKVPESGGSITVTVERKGGTQGDVTVQFATKNQTATAGKDYEKQEGTLEWKDGEEAPKTVTIAIFDDDEFEKDEHFTVVLSELTGGAKFDKNTDGGEDEEVCTVMILNDDDRAAKMTMAMKMLKLDSDSLEVASEDYAENVREAFAMPEDGGGYAIFMHVLTLPWKVMFKVLVPPAGLCNGWPCFFVALFWIGFQVVLISDFAGQMGCLMYLPDTITAITIVALGTSLPDTFASMQAARQDKSADSSIGNVTGSNSVNVFLGLGLPWLIGSAYWAMAGANAAWREKYGPYSYPPTNWVPGMAPPTGRVWDDVATYWDSGAFFVSSTGLGFSVLVFTILALLTVAMILFRRRLNPPAELGGNKATAKVHAAVLICFWLTYVILSCMTDPQFDVFSVDI